MDSSQNTEKKVHFEVPEVPAAAETDVPFESSSAQQVKACPFLKDNDVDEEEVASLVAVIGADEEGDSKRAGEGIRLMHQKIIQQKNTIEKDTATIETSMLQTAALSQSLQAKTTALKQLVPQINVFIKQLETQQAKGALTLGEASQAFEAITKCRALLQVSLKE